MEMLRAQDHAQSSRQGLELGGELIAHLLAIGHTLLRLHQLFQPQQLIALVVDGDTRCSQIAAIRLTRRAQVTPTGLSKRILMLAQIGLQRSGTGLDRAHMQDQTASGWSQQP